MITHTMNNSLAASKRDIIYNSEEDKLVSNHIILKNDFALAFCRVTRHNPFIDSSSQNNRDM